MKNLWLIWQKNDDRDFKAKHLVGKLWGIKLPDAFFLPISKAKNQWQTMRCTSYAITAIHQIMNEIEHNDVFDFLPDFLWDMQLTTWADETKGDYLQNALMRICKVWSFDDINLKHFKNKTYLRVDIDEIKRYIYKWFPIYTWLQIRDRTWDDITWVITDDRDKSYIWWHAFAITWWNNDDYIIQNSWGSDNWHNGLYYLPTSMEDELYRTYIIIDEMEDKDLLFKDVSINSWAYEYIKWAKNKWLINWYWDWTFRPDNNITRAEICSIMKNFYDIIKK